MEVRGHSSQDDDGDLDIEHRVPSRRLSVLRGKDVPDPGYQEDGIGRPLNAPEGSCNSLGRITAEGPHSREYAGDDKLTTYPDRRGQNMQGQANGVQGVGQGGKLHVGSFANLSRSCQEGDRDEPGWRWPEPLALGKPPVCGVVEVPSGRTCGQAPAVHHSWEEFKRRTPRADIHGGARPPAALRG